MAPMRNFADWIGGGFWVEGKLDVRERHPAFIHRKFRGLPAFESRNTSLLNVRPASWLRWLGSGDIQ
jgi:hypothetical protein